MPRYDLEVSSTRCSWLGAYNTYGFVEGNPVMYFDPIGLSKMDPMYGMEKAFWNWFHNLDGGKVIQAEKIGKNVPEDTASAYYKEWLDKGKPSPRNEGGYVDPALLPSIFLPWWWPLIEGPELACSEIDCNKNGIPDYEERRNPCP